MSQFASVYYTDKHNVCIASRTCAYTGLKMAAEKLKRFREQSLKFEACRLTADLQNETARVRAPDALFVDAVSCERTRLQSDEVESLCGQKFAPNPSDRTASQPERHV